MESTVTRAFRMPREIDSQLQEKARVLGYMNPSEYLRALVRKELENGEAGN